MGFHAMTDTPIIWAFIKSPNLGNVFMYDRIWIFNGSLGCLQKILVYFQPFSVQVSCRKNGTVNFEVYVPDVIFST